MTRRERILQILQKGDPDRPAVRITGTSMQNTAVGSDYSSIYNKAVEVSEIIESYAAPYDPLYGSASQGYIKTSVQHTSDPAKKHYVTSYSTPLGELRSVDTFSSSNIAGSRTSEYFIKEPIDIKKLLSIRYSPMEYDSRDYGKLSSLVGSRGIVLFELEHPAHTFINLVGPGNLDYIYSSSKDMFEELLSVLSYRAIEYLKYVLYSTDIAAFHWHSPELYAPFFLFNMNFRDFIHYYDKMVCDMIHNKGSFAIVSTGKLNEKSFNDYVTAGVDLIDCLSYNNITELIDEKRDLGDSSIGRQYCLDTEWLYSVSKSELESFLNEFARINGRKNYILALSGDFYEKELPTKQYIENLNLFLDFSLNHYRK